MCLSRRDFFHLETSRNAIKLTKISCDIAATPAAEPFNPSAPCGFGAVAPSGTSQRRHLPKMRSAHSVDTSSALCTLSTLLDPASSGPWQKSIARPLITNVIVSCPGEVRTFPPTDTPPRGRARHRGSRVPSISLFGQAFRSGSPQRKSLPLWLPRH